MPIRKLNALNVGTLPYIPCKGKRTDYTDSTRPGLMLRVTPGGVRTFVLAWKRRGKFNRITLGHFPMMSLGEAWEKALPMMQAVDRGADPHAMVNAGTVAQLVGRAIDWLEKKGNSSGRKLRPATADEYRRLLKAEIAQAPFAQTRALELRRGDAKAWLAKVAERSGYTANRTLGLLARAYSWACEHDILEHSPLLKLPKPGAETASDRVLSTAELRAVWRALDALWLEARPDDEAGPTPKRGQGKAAGGGGIGRRAYPDAARLLLLTMVRRSVVMGARRADLEGLDSKEPRWVIPQDRPGIKNRLAHVVPLSPAAVVAIKRRLAESTGPLLFRGIGRKEIPATWPSRWVRKLEEAAQAIYAKENKGAVMEPWTIHNFRHSAATHLREDLHVGKDVVELLLGHKAPGVGGIYDRAQLLPERRAALVAWAAWLARIAADKPGRAHVIPMAG